MNNPSMIPLLPLKLDIMGQKDNPPIFYRRRIADLLLFLGISLCKLSIFLLLGGKYAKNVQMMDQWWFNIALIMVEWWFNDA